MDRYSLMVHRRGAGQCWPWLGALSSTAHGKLRAGSRRANTSRVVTAHVLGYLLEHGANALREGQVVRHICDEPWCQSPDHWRPGERADNIADYYARRSLTGHALADARGPRGRAVAIQQAVRAALAAGGADSAAVEAAVDAAIASAIATGNPTNAHQISLL